MSLGYPKPRAPQTISFPLLRTDSATWKCTLPRDAIITGVFVRQTAAATTNPSTFALGWTGALTGVLNAFSLATTSVGFTTSGTTTGAQVGTKLTQDQRIISTCTPGASDTTSAGVCTLEYIIPGPGETQTS